MRADREAIRPLVGLSLVFGGLLVAFSSLRFGAEGRSGTAIVALAVGLVCLAAGIVLVRGASG